jgi:hypothetical protein
MSHAWLMRFLEHRIGERRMLRLIGKWLKTGVLEEGRLLTVDRGTPQGAVISPLLANIYLHYVYDLWVQRWRRDLCGGRRAIAVPTATLCPPGRGARMRGSAWLNRKAASRGGGVQDGHVTDAIVQPHQLAAIQASSREGG